MKAIIIKDPNKKLAKIVNCTSKHFSHICDHKTDKKSKLGPKKGETKMERIAPLFVKNKKKDQQRWIKTKS